MSATSLNVLIIGGSGFLSGTLARQAVAAGHRVWTITRGQRRQPPGVTPLVADRRDDAAFALAVRGAKIGWDLAVDCIAFRPEDVLQDVGVLAGHARHLIYVSTDFVYDPGHRRFPQPEETGHYLEDGYGGLKRRAEMALAAAQTGDMAWTIVRPCHIYGPGSQLGCLPLHGRDPSLLARLRAGEILRLVGGGHFLQQPVLASDLSRVILDLQGQPASFGQTFSIAGPDIVESREYYHIIADALQTELKIEEMSVQEHLSLHPEAAPFLCHRIYDMRKLEAAGITPPRTPLKVGLHEHVASLLAAEASV